MILADQHLHTSHSEDSVAPMEEMIEQGIRNGLDTMCFTEHMDRNFPGSTDEKKLFEVNVDEYLEHFLALKEKYMGKINLHFGLEYGMAAGLENDNATLNKKYPFDFVLASVHIINGIDIYYPEYYEEIGEERVYAQYFEEMSKLVRSTPAFDVLAHPDYVFRYGPNKNQNYSYAKIGDCFDETVRFLVDNGKGLELNTGGFKKLLNINSPIEDFLKRYKELGGETVTIGSDAHEPAKISQEFDIASGILGKVGFKYYSVFCEHKPKYFKL